METTVVSNTRITYYNTTEAFSMCVGTVGQLNQQCSEDQQLRAHSFSPEELPSANGSQTSVHQNHLEGYNNQLLGPIPRFSDP